MSTQPSPTPEKQELSYEQGVAQIMAQVKSLLVTQDYVVISIAGPLTNDPAVGKTTLSNRICFECQNLGTCTAMSDSVNMLSPEKITRPLVKSGYETNKHVVIIGAWGSPSHAKAGQDENKVAQFKLLHDAQITKAGKKIGWPLEKVDIRVFIHRPDKPAKDGDYMNADIVINNEKAVNK